MTSEIERSGPPRWMVGVTASQAQEVAKYLEAIKEDGADLEEAIHRLKNSKADRLPNEKDTGDPVRENQ